MSIRTQNMLAIGPLFLFLALVSGVLMIHAERRELLWGRREEASALAVATAEFIDGDAYRALTASGTAAPGFARLRVSLDRILMRKQARRILGLTADGRQIVFCFPSPPPDQPRGSAGLGGGGQGVRADDCFVTGVRTLSPGRAVLLAYAPIHDFAGRQVGVLGVETDAGGFLAATHRNLLRGAGAVGLVLLLGLMVITALSGMVTREVEELTRAAVQVREGNLERRCRPGRVQEVADLGNTFNTMTEVLQDVLARTRRSLIESEQFRTEADLARVYGERFWSPLRVDLGGARVAAGLVGARPTGAFYGTFAGHGGACWAIAGRVRQGGELDTVIDASTACALLRRELESGDAERVLARAAEQIALETLECLCWRPEDDGATYWRVIPSLGPPVRRALSLQPGGALALHSFEGEARETIERYAHSFAVLPPDELLADLAAVLSPDLDGSLLVVSRSEGAGPHPLPPLPTTGRGGPARRGTDPTIAPFGPPRPAFGRGGRG